MPLRFYLSDWTRAYLLETERYYASLLDISDRRDVEDVEYEDVTDLVDEDSGEEAYCVPI